MSASTLRNGRRHGGRRLLGVGLGAVTVIGLLATLSGCRGQKSRETPIFGIRQMYDQQKYDIQEESDFFEDKRTMRPPVELTVARDREIDVRVAEGRTDDGQAWVMTTPRSVVDSFGGMDATLKRGQERYNIFCAPCHDQTGAGNGMVKQRAVAAGAAAFVPPTYHQERIRHMPDGQLYATIANGKGNMPSYPQIAVNDRWAIVLYVRALQLSQAPLAPKEAAPAPTTSAPPPAPAAFEKKLSTGYDIKGAATGIEHDLLAFVEDAAKPVDTKTWFNFDQLVFKTGAAELDMDESKAQLDNIAEILKAFPKVKLKIGGYTDNTGAADVNKKLSQERADAVKKALVAKGTAPARLEAEGYGPEHAVCPANDTDECKAKNRRIAVRVMEK